MSLLVNCGADIDGRREDSTAFFIAESSEEHEHHDDAVQLSLDCDGADANHLDDGGLTPLINAPIRSTLGISGRDTSKGWGVWVLPVGISGLQASGSASTHELNSSCLTESQAVVRSIFSSPHCTECVPIPLRIAVNLYCSWN